MSRIKPCCCGECAFFKYEDLDGYGICAIGDYHTNCADDCCYSQLSMDKKEVVRALHYLQKWRRGGNIDMPHPFVAGKAIDNAIRLLRNSEK